MPDHTTHTQITADTHEETPLPTRRLQCRHIFTDGHRCGSPCLRGEGFCYYHHRSREARPHTAHPIAQFMLKPSENTFLLAAPADLADRSGIQHTLTVVLNRIANNEIDPRRAGLLL